MKKPSDTSTFHFYNANPSNHRAGDCVARAISAATDIPWDATMRGIVEIAIAKRWGPTDKQAYGAFLEKLGWARCKQPKKDDGTKYTGKEFCEQLACDPWIFTGAEGATHAPIVAHIGGHHVVCIKDCRVWDSWDSTEGCIGNYWVRS